jgi:hypothetical protein
MTIRAFALMVLLASRFDIRKRRPYEFAIHNASSKRIKKEKIADPEFTSVECDKNSKSQAAAFLRRDALTQ